MARKANLKRTQKKKIKLTGRTTCHLPQFLLKEINDAPSGFSDSDYYGG